MEFVGGQVCCVGGKVHCDGISLPNNQVIDTMDENGYLGVLEGADIMQKEINEVRQRYLRRVKLAAKWKLYGENLCDQCMLTGVHAQAHIFCPCEPPPPPPQTFMSLLSLIKLHFSTLIFGLHLASAH